MKSKKNEVTKVEIKFFDLVKRFNGESITSLDWSRIKKIYLSGNKVNIPFNILKDLFIQEKMFLIDTEEKLLIEKDLNTAILNYNNNGDIEPENLKRVTNKIRLCL